MRQTLLVLLGSIFVANGAFAQDRGFTDLTVENYSLETGKSYNFTLPAFTATASSVAETCLQHTSIISSNTVNHEYRIYKKSDSRLNNGEIIASWRVDAGTEGEGDATVAAVSSEVPSGLAFDESRDARTLTGTPTTLMQEETYLYAVIFPSNSECAAHWVEFDIEVVSGNSAPAFGEEITITISNIDSGAKVGDPVTAVDPDKDKLEYSISGDDAKYFNIDSATGQITISGDPPVDPEEKSEFSVIVKATDGSGESDTIDITIKVVIDPELNNAEAAASVLPFLAGEMADQSVGSISGRFERPDSDNSDSGLSGKSVIAAAFFANKEAIANGTRSLGEVLRSVEGTVASSSQDPMSATPNMDWSVWVNGMHGSIKGNAAGLKWDGKVTSSHLGFDVRASADVLVGIQLSLIKGEADFGESARDKGKFEIDLTAAYPFVGWISPDGNLDMWATAGIGSGDLTVTRNSSVYGGKDGKNDIKTQTFALGVRSVVMESEQTDLHVKASGIVTSMDIKDGDAIAATSVKSNILRIGVEASQKSITKAGDVVAFSEQLSIRHDSGGGSSATGVEIGAGMQFTTNDGLSISTDALALVGSDKLKGWRIGGSVGFDQHRNKHGLSVKLSSEYAQADTAATLDEQLAGTLSGKGNVSDATVSAGIGYGLGLPSGVVMTPFSEVVAASDSRNYRLGTRWEQSSAFSLRLFGEQRESHSSNITNSINFGGEFKF